MKFSGYTSNTRLQDGTPHVSASGNAMAYGMGGSGWRQAGQALDKVAGVVQKKQDEDDAQDLLDARNKIMTSLTQQMYDGENGLMTTGYGENSKGLTGRVTDAVHRTTDEVLQNYNGRVQAAIRRTMKDNFDNFQRLAASRESAEGVKLKAARYDGNIKAGVQLCGLNYNNDEMIRTQLQEGLKLTQAMGQDMGLPGAAVVAKQRGMYTDSISAAVGAAMNGEDFARARKLLDEYRKDMDINAWLKLDDAVKKKQEIKDTFAKGEEIFTSAGGDLRQMWAMCKEAATGKDGTYDAEKAAKIYKVCKARYTDEQRATKAEERELYGNVRGAVRKAGSSTGARRAIAENSENLSLDQVNGLEQDADTQYGSSDEEAAAASENEAEGEQYLGGDGLDKKDYKNLNRDIKNINIAVRMLKGGKDLSETQQENLARTVSSLADAEAKLYYGDDSDMEAKNLFSAITAQTETVSENGQTPDQIATELFEKGYSRSEVFDILTAGENGMDDFAAAVVVGRAHYSYTN